MFIVEPTYVVDTCKHIVQLVRICLQKYNNNKYIPKNFREKCKNMQKECL